MTLAERETQESLGASRGEVTSALKGSGIELKLYFETSLARTALYVCVLWGAALALAGVWVVGDVFQRVLVFLAFGIIQHAFINGVHEASHYCLARDRRVNEGIGNFFFALPIGLTVARYRVTHTDHHRYLNSERDPSNFVSSTSLSPLQVMLTLAWLACGRAVFDILRSALRKHETVDEGDRGSAEAVAHIDRRRALYALAYHLPLMAIAFALQHLDLWIAWALSAMTLAPFFDGLRTVAEHRAGSGDGARFHTRSHHRSRIVSMLFAPLFQYHWEHHLFPGIPHHRLAELHSTLCGLGIAGSAPVAGGFFGALRRGLTPGNE